MTDQEKVPASEAWIHNNPELLARIKAAWTQSESGEGHAMSLPYDLKWVGNDVVLSKGSYSVRVHIDEYTSWRNGTLIQFAMPRLNAEQREFLISGTTPYEWAKMFPEEP